MRTIEHASSGTRERVFYFRKIAEILEIHEKTLAGICRSPEHADNPIRKIIRTDHLTGRVFAFRDELESFMEGTPIGEGPESKQAVKGASQSRSIANPKPRGRRKATA